MYKQLLYKYTKDKNYYKNKGIRRSGIQQLSGDRKIHPPYVYALDNQYNSYTLEDVKHEDSRRDRIFGRFKNHNDDYKQWRIE